MDLLVKTEPFKGQDQLRSWFSEQFCEYADQVYNCLKLKMLTIVNGVTTVFFSPVKSMLCIAYCIDLILIHLPKYFQALLHCFLHGYFFVHRERVWDNFCVDDNTIFVQDETFPTPEKGMLGV